MRHETSFVQFQHLLKKYKLSANAPKIEIKKEHLRQMKQFHPDVNSSKEAKHKFLQAQEHFEKLHQCFNNKQFMAEYARFKLNLRNKTLFNSNEHFSQQSDDNLERDGNLKNHGRKSTLYEKQSQYNERHSKVNPFEEMRNYYENKHYGNAEGYDSWNSAYSSFGRHKINFFFRFISILWFLFPVFIFSHFFTEDRTKTKFNRNHTKQKKTLLQESEYLICRDIKLHLWEELQYRVKKENLIFSRPSSQLLQFIDSLVEQTGYYTVLTKKQNITAKTFSPTDLERIKTIVGNNKQVLRLASLESSGTENEEFFSKYNTLVARAVHSNEQFKKIPGRWKRHFGRDSTYSEINSKHDPYYYFQLDIFNELHRATINQDFNECLRLLLNGIHAGLPDRKRRTALHYAAYSGQIDLCRLLLLFNANPLAKDGFQETPIDAARSAGKYNIEHMLLFAVTGSFVLAQYIQQNMTTSYAYLFRSITAANIGEFLPDPLIRRLKTSAT